MSIAITRPWARIQTIESREAGGFLTFNNDGPEADRLVGAESPLADKIDLHGIKVVGAGTRMMPLEKGLGIPVGMPIELKPRGYHLQLHGLRAPLQLGQKVPVTLLFEKAGRRDVELVVEAEGPIGSDVLGNYKSPG
jgi:periplasmic copper chaperone A